MGIRYHHIDERTGKTVTEYRGNVPWVDVWRSPPLNVLDLMRQAQQCSILRKLRRLAAGPRTGNPVAIV